MNKPPGMDTLGTLTLTGRNNKVLDKYDKV